MEKCWGVAMKNRFPSWIIILGITGFLLINSPAGWAQSQAFPIPTIKIGVGESKDPGEVSVLIQILILLTVLSLAPAILIMMTSFTRLVVVFAFLRQALGTTVMPPTAAPGRTGPVSNLLYYDPCLADDP